MWSNLPLSLSGNVNKLNTAGQSLSGKGKDTLEKIISPMVCTNESVLLKKPNRCMGSWANDVGRSESLIQAIPLLALKQEEPTNIRH